MSTPRCTVPAPRAPSAVHGIVPDSAQSIFIVGLSHWNLRRAAHHRGGHPGRPEHRLVQRGGPAAAHPPLGPPAEPTGEHAPPPGPPAALDAAPRRTGAYPPA